MTDVAIEITEIHTRSNTL